MGSASQPWQRVSRSCIITRAWFVTVYLMQSLLAEVEGGVDSIVASVHLKMAEIAETAAEQSDAQVQLCCAQP